MTTIRGVARRWAVATVPGACALGFLLLAGCGDRASEEAPSPEVLRWEAVADADAYRIRAWSGTRLLFEETTRGDSLAWTPALLRTARAFDAVTVRVQALDADRRPLGEVIERELEP